MVISTNRPYPLCYSPEMGRELGWTLGQRIGFGGKSVPAPIHPESVPNPSSNITTLFSKQRTSCHPPKTRSRCQKTLAETLPLPCFITACKIPHLDFHSQYTYFFSETWIFYCARTRHNFVFLFNFYFLFRNHQWTQSWVRGSAFFFLHRWIVVVVLVSIF